MSALGGKVDKYEQILAKYDWHAVRPPRGYQYGVGRGAKAFTTTAELNMASNTQHPTSAEMDFFDALERMEKRKEHARHAHGKTKKPLPKTLGQGSGASCSAAANAASTTTCKLSLEDISSVESSLASYRDAERDRGGACSSNVTGSITITNAPTQSYSSNKRSTTDGTDSIRPSDNKLLSPVPSVHESSSPSGSVATKPVPAPPLVTRSARIEAAEQAEEHIFSDERVITARDVLTAKTGATLSGLRNLLEMGALDEQATWITHARAYRDMGMMRRAMQTLSEGCLRTGAQGSMIWYERLRLIPRDNPAMRRRVLEEAVASCATAEELWLDLLPCEPAHEQPAWLQRAVMGCPSGQKLWLRVLRYAPAKRDQRRIIQRALQCTPQLPRLWARLARLECQYATGRDIFRAAAQLYPSLELAIEAAKYVEWFQLTQSNELVLPSSTEHKQKCNDNNHMNGGSSARVSRENDYAMSDVSMAELIGEAARSYLDVHDAASRRRWLDAASEVAVQDGCVWTSAHMYLRLILPAHTAVSSSSVASMARPLDHTICSNHGHGDSDAQVHDASTATGPTQSLSYAASDTSKNSTAAALRTGRWLHDVWQLLPRLSQAQHAGQAGHEKDDGRTASRDKHESQQFHSHPGGSVPHSVLCALWAAWLLLVQSTTSNSIVVSSTDPRMACGTDIMDATDPMLTRVICGAIASAPGAVVHGAVTQELHLMHQSAQTSSSQQQQKEEAGVVRAGGEVGVGMLYSSDAASDLALMLSIAEEMCPDTTHANTSSSNTENKKSSNMLLSLAKVAVNGTRTDSNEEDAASDTCSNDDAMPPALIGVMRRTWQYAETAMSPRLALLAALSLYQRKAYVAGMYILMCRAQGALAAHMPTTSTAPDVHGREMAGEDRAETHVAQHAGVRARVHIIFAMGLSALHCNRAADCYLAALVHRYCGIDVRRHGKDTIHDANGDNDNNRGSAFSASTCSPAGRVVPYGWSALLIKLAVHRRHFSADLRAPTCSSASANAMQGTDSHDASKANLSTDVTATNTRHRHDEMAELLQRGTGLFPRSTALWRMRLAHHTRQLHLRGALEKSETRVGALRELRTLCHDALHERHGPVALRVSLWTFVALEVDAVLLHDAAAARARLADAEVALHSVLHSAASPAWPSLSMRHASLYEMNEEDDDALEDADYEDGEDMLVKVESRQVTTVGAGVCSTALPVSSSTAASATPMTISSSASCNTTAAAIAATYSSTEQTRRLAYATVQIALTRAQVELHHGSPAAALDCVRHCLQHLPRRRTGELLHPVADELLAQFVDLHPPATRPRAAALVLRQWHGAQWALPLCAVARLYHSASNFPRALAQVEKAMRVSAGRCGDAVGLLWRLASMSNYAGLVEQHPLYRKSERGRHSDSATSGKPTPTTTTTDTTATEIVQHDNKHIIIDKTDAKSVAATYIDGNKESVDNSYANHHALDISERETTTATTMKTTSPQAKPTDEGDEGQGQRASTAMRTGGTDVGHHTAAPPSSGAMTDESLDEVAVRRWVWRVMRVSQSGWLGQSVSEEESVTRDEEATRSSVLVEGAGDEDETSLRMPNSGPLWLAVSRTDDPANVTLLGYRDSLEMMLRKVRDRIVL